MRKVLTLFLLVASNAYSGVPMFKAALIYNQLVATSGIKNAPRLAINEDPKKPPNGSYDKKSHIIILNISFLREFDEDTVATTLGHELVHAKYKDWKYFGITRDQSRSQEKRADLEGQIITERAGYNSCKGFKWIRDQHYTNDYWHPDSDVRNKYLKCK